MQKHTTALCIRGKVNATPAGNNSDHATNCNVSALHLYVPQVCPHVKPSTGAAGVQQSETKEKVVVKQSGLDPEISRANRIPSCNSCATAEREPRPAQPSSQIPRHHMTCLENAFTICVTNAPDSNTFHNQMDHTFHTHMMPITPVQPPTQKGPTASLSLNLTAHSTWAHCEWHSPDSNGIAHQDSTRQAASSGDPPSVGCRARTTGYNCNQVRYPEEDQASVLGALSSCTVCMPSLTVQHAKTQTQHNQDHSGLVEGSGKAYEQADVQGAAMRPCMAHM